MARRKTVASYLKQIETKAKSKDCVYRGQANAEWPLRSGAERRIRKKSEIDKIPPGSLESYHNDLLDEARRKGFGIVDGRDLKDLELLAALQYFEAATCLLDFTKQALVALYFACKDENKEDGKIFIVSYRTITLASGKEIIKDLLTNEKPALWWPMLHGAAERRIMIQHGLFLINITENHKNIEYVIIRNEDKKGILEELKSTYQINADTLYMDLSGFAQNRAVNMDLSDYSVYLYNGIDKCFRDQYEESIKDFDEAIKLNPDGADAYRWRGMAKDELEQYEEAIKDFDKTIKLNPDGAGVYQWRGMAKYKLKQYEEAIKDFNEAIKLNPNDAGEYRWRGMAKYKLKQYEEAIKDFDKAIKLNPDDTDAYQWRDMAKNKLKQH